MNKTKMTSRVKIITALELILFPLSLTSRIIVANITWNSLMTGLNGYGYNGSKAIGTDSAYLSFMLTYVSLSMFFLPCLIVAIINLRNKRSNGNILMIVACAIYSLYTIIVIVREKFKAPVEFLLLIYFVVLLVLVALNMRVESKSKNLSQLQEIQQIYPQTYNNQITSYCINCGLAINPEDRYCQNCGTFQYNKIK